MFEGFGRRVGEVVSSTSPTNKILQLTFAVKKSQIKLCVHLSCFLELTTSVNSISYIQEYEKKKAKCRQGRRDKNHNFHNKDKRILKFRHQASKSYLMSEFHHPQHNSMQKTIVRV